MPRGQGHDRPGLVELAVLHHLDLHDLVDGEVKLDATPRIVGDDTQSCLVARIRGEERFLSANLAGYTDYVARVRFRLIPGLF